ncbi:TIGR04551 family protein [Haliangium ochraceum]|uniref:TIGR04551 family protein n=1 Tax=Haliangium ochraceum TaxID=80816 RepID=UPI00019BA557|nr:TIGR04551 family protein [Haliangium ochraceum]
MAEQAESAPQALPTTPVLPPISNERKRFQLFELDGYFRLRTNYFKNFNLGFDPDAAGGAPYPRPLSCSIDDDDSVSACGDTLQSVDMRLRLDPTVNISETAKVHFQIDALDNVVLGSTPAFRAVPGASADSGLPSGFDDNQAPPEAGVNHYIDSLRVKRAWAEVQTSLGQLTFGRQPWHWGLGIFANAGGFDPWTDTYDTDSDYGDTVDRIMFRTRVPGTRIDAAISMDWAATGATADQTGLYLSDPSGYTGRVGSRPFDLDDADDVSQWTFHLTRFDAPERFRERVARGEMVLNYGGMLVYRTQDNEFIEAVDFGNVDTPVDNQSRLLLVNRGLTTYTPDLWLRFATGALVIEAEATLTLGSVDNVGDLDNDGATDDDQDPGRVRGESVDLLRMGAVARARYSALDDTMRFGLEAGLATGDDADNTPAGAMHVGNIDMLALDNGSTLGTFVFDPEYNVDLILFREIVGAVTNAFYVRPSLNYEVGEGLDAGIAAVISGPAQSQATPGNGGLYGVELDASASFRRGGFFATLAGGILFPFGALGHDAGDDAFDLEEGALDVDAENAYTIQTRFGLEF